MSKCKESCGRTAIRRGVGGFRCSDCQRLLSEYEVPDRLLLRIEEIEGDQFKMIGALQVLGADQCDKCGEWKKRFWQTGDQCFCLDCLTADPSFPLECVEEDPEKVARSLVRYLVNAGFVELVKKSRELLPTFKEMTKRS